MLLPTLTTWRSQFERMKRSYARVTGPYQSSVEFEDDLHHFMQDCWHLKDWIKNDPSAGIGAAEIEKYVGDYRSLCIVADLANGSKHFLRHMHKKGAYVTSIGVTVHLGQRKPIDVDCTVTLADGTNLPVQAVVHEAFTDWNELLKKVGLIS